ncbi:MAG: site-2 protease family protein [bacterium]|nr:site-2 protease family protein [bacterium]
MKRSPPMFKIDGDVAMFGKSVRLFKLLGFSVKIDVSWLILALLITWSLAKGLFPTYFENLPTATYWWMGVAGAIGLFFSIVFHELSHSLVARNYGIPIRGITLFIFGGVAEMHEEPQTPKSELLMAIAGPISSLVLGGVFYGVHLIGKHTMWGEPVHGVLIYLAIINLILAGFNMLPAFPLDGGRVLRSILWSWKDSLRWATRISSQIGSAFGVILIILGAINFFSGNVIGGVWWFLIGLFMRSASQMSYQQLIIRKALEGETIERFMKKNPVTVPPTLSLYELVENFIYKYHFKIFPVVKQAELLGCVKSKQLKEIPREEWKKQTVGDIFEKCSADNTIAVDTDAVKALSAMKRSSNSRIMVVDKNNKLAGILSLKDLMEFLSLKIELEDKD